jgi:hypothetical protein
MSTTPRPGYIEIRDPQTLRLVCRYNPHTHEVEVVQRGDVRRATLPIADPARVAQYIEIVQRHSKNQ